MGQASGIAWNATASLTPRLHEVLDGPEREEMEPD
jgi:hypothetical protein